jgi:hypothetical protein
MDGYSFNALMDMLLMHALRLYQNISQIDAIQTTEHLPLLIVDSERLEALS